MKIHLINTLKKFDFDFFKHFFGPRQDQNSLILDKFGWTIGKCVTYAFNKNRSELGDGILAITLL